MDKIAICIDKFSEAMGRATAWLSVLMVLVTFVIVVLRYGFNLGWIAMQESVTAMHALLFMLGLVYCLKRNGHVRVDIFYNRWSLQGKAWIDLLGTVLFLLPFCLFIFLVSWNYVLRSWLIWERSMEAGGLPGLFLLKSLIPLMTVLLMLQGLSEGLKCLSIICGIKKDPLAS